MYRHFATITAAVTALVAFMANGEQTGAAETPVHAAKAVAKAKDSAVEASERAVPVDQGSFGSDDNSDFGKPTTSAPGGGSWFSNPFAGAQPGVGPALNPQIVDGQDDQSGDSAKQPATAPAPTEAQISAAMNASRLRSGAFGGD